MPGLITLFKDVTTARIYSVMDHAKLADPNAKPVELKRKTSVRVPPGTYTVGVSCIIGRFIVYLPTLVTARENTDYLFECTGNSAAETRVVVHSVSSASPN